MNSTISLATYITNYSHFVIATAYVIVELAMSNGECGPGIGSIVTGAFGGFGPTGGAIRGVGRGGGLSVDPIYQLLKQAAEVGSGGAGSSRLKEGNAMSSGSNLGLLPSGQRSDNLQTRRPRSNASSTSSSSHMLTVSPHAPHHSSSSGQWSNNTTGKMQGKTWI